MMTLFELEVAYDVGGPEDGIVVRECTDYYDCSVNLFQPITDIYNEVREQYYLTYGDAEDFIGCKVVRLIPEDEAEKIRKECGFYDDYQYIDGEVMW